MYNPNEPRDNMGKWTDAGISSAIMDKIAPGLKEEKKSAKDPKFIPAETIMEAEEGIKKAGVEAVNFNGEIDTEMANPILKAIEKENSIAPLKLSGIDVVYFPGDSGIAAAYNFVENKLEINPVVLSGNNYAPLESYESELTKLKKQQTTIMQTYLGKKEYDQETVNDRLHSISSRISTVTKEISSGEKPVFWGVGQSYKEKAKQIEATITHEIGHYREAKLEKEGAVNFKFNKKTSISEYGKSSSKEYFAEWYSRYRMEGEKGVPKDLLSIFKKIK